ncbi:hypothetical protein CONCODRAFT_76965 [Conidiobolus coronatus NRRL 28638]|uniref:Uncharacterized protein n=1 Tax=Conidiobolus coronatus (strain ATCC 28846 / CBS 209.66 / NRRL 28638) TaxID=796925 RepID=A0A137PGU8_CONC2|nr:hypothetical protein CONCODRAFT_76965 [Conidiobolus coronatus NRRL 28638]|eukprot:KXN74226.1 hypothetical protein CONCODRAFT_76965 [Conidiobolus coronatus NRRL 28638]
MESYYGYVGSSSDVLILFRAVELGLVQTVKRRLDSMERNLIRSGSIYIWEEVEANIRRWTDYIPWSSSRDDGLFLNYFELEAGLLHPSASVSNQAKKQIKQGGLIKRTFSSMTIHGKKYHLVNYYYKSDISKLTRPSEDNQFFELILPKNYFFSLNSNILVTMQQQQQQQQPQIPSNSIEELNTGNNSSSNIHSLCNNPVEEDDTRPRTVESMIRGMNSVLPPINDPSSPTPHAKMNYDKEDQRQLDLLSKQLKL